MTLGNRIKEIRTDNKMIQKEFAEALSVSRPFISRVEADNETPSDSLLKLISATFNISLNWIKYGQGLKESQDSSINKFLELQEGLLLDGMEKYDFASWSSIILTLFKKNGLKENSERYYRDCIKSILSVLNRCLNEDSLNCDKEFWEAWTNFIGKKMEEASRAFEEENLDDLIQ